MQDKLNARQMGVESTGDGPEALNKISMVGGTG